MSRKELFIIAWTVCSFANGIKWFLVNEDKYLILGCFAFIMTKLEYMSLRTQVND